MAIRVTANGLRNIIRSVILEESRRRNSQRRLQESRRRRAYRLYEGFEDKLAKYNPDAQELADITAAKDRFSPTFRSGRVGDRRAHMRTSFDNAYIAGDPMRHAYMEADGSYADPKAVGTVDRLHSMVTGITNEVNACSVLALNNIEPLTQKAAGELIYYQDADYAAFNQAMDKLYDMIDFMYTNDMNEIDGCEDGVDSIQRLFNLFGGERGYGY